MILVAFLQYFLLFMRLQSFYKTCLYFMILVTFLQYFLTFHETLNFLSDLFTFYDTCNFLNYFLFFTRLYFYHGTFIILRGVYLYETLIFPDTSAFSDTFLVLKTRLFCFFRYFLRRFESEALFLLGELSFLARYIFTRRVEFSCEVYIFYETLIFSYMFFYETSVFPNTLFFHNTFLVLKTS